MTGSFSFAWKKLFLLTFTDLIADGATGFASGLTGGLAFSATAFCQRGLKSRFVDGFNVFHSLKLLPHSLI